MKNYSVTEREALAAVAGVKYFQPYLYGRTFFIHMDHNAARWLTKIREPTGHLARRALLLQQYDLEIVHRSGRNNGNVDALSRREYDSVVATLDTAGVQTQRIKELNVKTPTLQILLSTWNWKTFRRTARLARNFSIQLSSTTSTLMESYVTFGFQEVKECQRPGRSS